MTVRMQTRDTRWATPVEIDLRSPTYLAEQFNLDIEYGSPARLTWVCKVAQHLKPIAEGTFVIFWDDDAEDEGGNPYSDENPLFVGYVETPLPGQSTREVRYTAYDPTHRASREVTVFDAPWPPGEIPGTPPEPEEDSVPRLIYNVRITNDPDWAFQVGGDGTLTQIIGGLLDYHYQPLYWLDAADGDGTNEGNEAAYVTSDLAGMTHKPQEKLDFQSESIFSAVERLQQYDPRYRCTFDPALRRWRFRNITSAPTVTLNVNNPSVAHPVLSLNIQPSTEQAVTAVSVYGPPSAEFGFYEWAEDELFNSLSPVGDPIIFETYTDISGEHPAQLWQTFQITDSANRRGARQLPDSVTYAKAPNIFGTTLFPLLMCSWDNGTTWVEWYSCWFDFGAGTVTFNGSPPFFYQVDGNGDGVVPGSTQKYFPPNAVKLIWAPFGPPLKVRRPASGYEGTAYSVAGKTVHKHQYDEALAVGREYGIPVTTSARRAQFEQYAQTFLDQRKNIVWAGGCTLHGLDWRFLRLNRRVRFSVGNGDGGTLSTGWETIDAWVTGVVYDFAARTTTLTFSSDALALMGVDPEQLKALLKIKALEQREVYETKFIFRTFVNGKGYTVNQVTGVVTTKSFDYVDPETGGVQ